MNENNVQNVIFEMLEDRGYSLIKSMEKQDNQIKILFEKKDESKNKILVVLLFENGKKEIINKLAVKLNEMKIKNCILVLNNISSQSREIIPELKNTGGNSIFIEIFEFIELTHNVSRNIMVPKHELLSEEETNILLNEYKIKKNQLPIILDTDPQVRYHNWDVNSVIKITRRNGEIYYRCIKKTHK